MADTFDVVAQRPTTQFIGGTQTKDVIAVGIVTKPSSIYVEFLIPRTGYAASVVNAAALGYATIYETVAALPGVAGVQWAQDQNDAGYLVDVTVITVASTSGDSTATLTVQTPLLGPQLHEPQIIALRKQLDAAEKL